MDKNIFCSIPIYRSAIFEPRHLRRRLSINPTHDLHFLALLNSQIGRHWFYWSTFTCKRREKFVRLRRNKAKKKTESINNYVSCAWWIHPWGEWNWKINIARFEKNLNFSSPAKIQIHTKIRKGFPLRQPQEKRRRRRPQISKLSLDRSRTRSDSCVTTSKLRNCAIGRGERSQCPSDEHQIRWTWSEKLFTEKAKKLVANQRRSRSHSIPKPMPADHKAN